MSRLYPPVTEEVLSAFCLSYDDDGNKTGVSININFNLNKAVASSEINGMALRLRTISTNQYVITENIEINSTTGLSEGIAVYYDLTDGECIFQITSENNEEAVNKLKVGQYYKAQIAFIDTSGDIGYWSNVATIKCVAKPSVIIANFDPTDANIFSNEIVGEYIQDTSTGDSSEKVYSYRFQLYDNEDNLIEDTGVQLHNSSYDTSANSSTDIFYCFRELDEEKNYYLTYSVTTINGLKVSSATYQVIAANLVEPEDPIILNVVLKSDNSWHPEDEGLVKLYLSLPEDNLKKTLTGNYSISRSSFKDNFTTWEQIGQFRLVEAKPENYPIYDYTVEQGVIYHYAVQQFNRQQFYSKKVYYCDSNNEPIDVKVNFEDMFLYDGERQLKVRFNPKVTSFKNDLQEQKIDTIGSKHPFIFRNGNICYKEFPVSGLISFQMDENELFIKKEDSEQMELDRFKDLYRRNQVSFKTDYKIANYNEIFNYNGSSEENSEARWFFVFQDQNTAEILAKSFKNFRVLENGKYNLIDKTTAKKFYSQGITVYYREVNLKNQNFKESYGTTPSKTDLTADNIATERYFKLLVLDWLTDGKPKLFRSPTEGNYIVRLLNVSLMPKTELGRMIHEFTCTAYEIADFTNKNLDELGFFPTINFNEVEYAWYSQNLKNIFDQEPDGGNGYYQLPLNQKKIVAFECLGFSPNDRIKIVLEDEIEPLDILIGTTGTYIYDEGKTIISISFLLDQKYEDFPRDIRLKAKGYVYQKFDTISSITLQTKIGEQFTGPRDNLLEECTVGIGNNYPSAVNLNLLQNEGNKLKVTEILYLKAKKREVIPIFYSGTIDVDATTGLEYSLAEAFRDSNVTFYLTPYGQGYVNGKAIVPPNVNTIWNSNKYFKIEDMAKAMSIHDLVEITNTSNLIDEFCLFEVYLPWAQDDTTTIWVPWRERNFTGSAFGTHLQGIFDPWLYKYQQERISEKNNIYLGWWPRPDHIEWFNNVVFPVPEEKIEEYYGNGYETKLIFTYSSEQNSIIELKDKEDLVLKNISVPETISCSNGVVLEMIYRVQETNYTLEVENDSIKQLKTNYQFVVENAIAKTKGYNIAKLYNYLGSKLIEKYSTELSQLQDANTYKNIIRYLVDEAREQQIDKIANYLRMEQNLVNSAYYQLKTIEPYPEDLEYTSLLNNFLSKIITKKNNYDSIIGGYFNQINQKNIIYTIEEIQNIDGDFSTPVLSQINTIIQNFINNGFLNDIQVFSNSLTQNIQEMQDKLVDLKNQKYIEQYLNLLSQKAKNLYLSNNGYNLCYKETPNEQDLTRANIFDLIWDDTFFFDGHLIPRLVISDTERINYPQIIENYRTALLLTESSDEDTFIYGIDQNSEIFNGLEDLEESLNGINENTPIPNTNDEMTIDIYNERYAPFTFSVDVYPYYYNANNQYTYTNNILLSTITVGKNMPNKITSLEEFCSEIGYINTNSLEYYIDIAYSKIKSTNINMLIQEMSENREQIINLPDKLKTGNETEATFKEYLTYYFMVGNVDNKQKSLRDIYKEIQACAVYYNAQKDTLTEDQKKVIKETIEKLINNYNSVKLSSSDELLKTCLENARVKFFESVKTWNRDYAELWRRYSGTSEQDEAIKDFDDNVELFNTKYVDAINIKINDFLAYREEYKGLQKNYNASDNIKEIFEQRKDNYEEVIAQLNDNYSLLNNVLSTGQNQAILTGYIDFLNTYFTYIRQFNYEDSYEKLQQSLLEAEGMYSAKVEINNSPYNQLKEIQESWKKYIDALKIVYIQEVKERFD